MTKIHNLGNSYFANVKLFFYRFWHWFFSLIILLITIFAVFIINNMVTAQKDSRTKDEFMAEYTLLRENAINLLDVIEGRTISAQPYDNDPKRVVALRKEIELYDFYIRTQTCENDYIILNDSRVNWWTSQAKLKGVSAQNITYILGISFIFLTILAGSIAYRPFYANSMFFLSGNLNKTTLIMGRTLFLWSLLAIFLLTAFISNLIILNKAVVKWVFFIYNNKIITQSIYSLVFCRLLFISAAGWFFYNLTTFITTLTKKSSLGFIISVIIYGVLVALGKLSEMFLNVSALRFVVTPVAGLLFNSKGFYDFTVYYNLPLAIAGGILLYRLSRKKFISF